MSTPSSPEALFNRCELTFDYSVRENGKDIGSTVIRHGEPVFVIGLGGENFGEGRFLGCEPIEDEEEPDFMPMLEVQGHVFGGYECFWTLAADEAAAKIRDLPVTDIKEYLAIMAIEDSLTDEADAAARQDMGLDDSWD